MERPLFRKRRVSENPVVNLARCIAFCDNLRAYQRSDLAEVDETFEALRKTRFRDHSEMWEKARPAADKIATMPLKIPGVKAMIGVVSWTKLLGRAALIVMVILIALQIVPIWQNVLGPDALGGNLLLATLMIVVAAIVLLTLSSVFDYFIRKRVIEFEDSTIDEYAPFRSRMKDCVNRMLRSLSREVGRGRETPDSLSMVLNFGDYDNVDVVSRWQPKSMGFIKKTSTRFLVKPLP